MDDFLKDDISNLEGEISLSDLEGELNPVLERVKERLMGQKAGEPIRAGHSSHSSSSGRGHSSHVSGRFEEVIEVP